MEKWLHINTSIWRYLLKEKVCNFFSKLVANLIVCVVLMLPELSALHNNFAP